MEYKPDKIEKERPNMAFHPLLWLFGIGWWVCVFWFGFFKTIMWTLIMSAIGAIVIITKENTRV